MTKTITAMQNDIINKFGFEHKNTIKFFRITEYKYAKKLIHATYNKMMAQNISADDNA